MATHLVKARCLGWATQGFSATVLALFGAAAVAADLSIGVNAEVSYRESAAEVRQRHQPMLDELAKATGLKFEFSPVYSDKVDQAIAAGQFDLLMIHTHLALKAERSHKYQVVGFTDDRKNNAVFFFVRPDSTINTLADAAVNLVASPGESSWASATAQSMLESAAPGKPLRFVRTRYADAVPLLVDMKSAEVGISRAKSVVEEHAASKKIRVIHESKPLPLNALIASPKVPAGTVQAIRVALTKMAQSKAFDGLAFKSVRYSEEQSQQLHTFYK